MGGKAFESDGLAVPRMPTDVYRYMLAQVLAKLRPVFVRVETPIEAPEKVDHGDVDILVLTHNQGPSTQEIAKILGAKRFRQLPNDPTINFAVPWPESSVPSSIDQPAVQAEVVNHDGINLDRTDMRTDFLGIRDEREADGKAASNDPGRFVQVDIHMCRDIQELESILFLHAHGDLVSMVAATIRRFGLTLSNSGLYVRIEELERWNKNQARYKLTDKPSEILKYLGLDERVFWQPFDSWDDCMDFAATCRFHDPARGSKYDDATVKQEFNAHDHKRANKRPMFGYWMEKYLPAHRDHSAGSASNMTRGEVIDDIKLTFGEDFSRKFEKHRYMYIREMGIEQLWSSLRKEVGAVGSQLTYAMKGLKREIIVIPEDQSLLSDVQRDYLTGDFDRVKEWCLGNWREVGIRQEQLDREKSTQKLLAASRREAD